MAQKIITGYTGTRHISPEMDASVWRSAFGEDSYILATGNKCAGSMPSINEFVIRDGVVSIQGYLGYGTTQSLVIDVCATGFSRIDYVCARYAHDIGSLIDSIDYVVIKGAEVAAPNVPTPPSIHTGIIKDGANEVDFPLYQINLEGGNVTFDKIAPTATITLGGMGESDISSIGDGTVTGAIKNINDNSARAANLWTGNISPMFFGYVTNVGRRIVLETPFVVTKKVNTFNLTKAISHLRTANGSGGYVGGADNFDLLPYIDPQAGGVNALRRPNGTMMVTFIKSDGFGAGNNVPIVGTIDMTVTLA